MFRGVNVAHKYVNAEVGAALPRFLAPAGRCSLFGQQKRSRFVASPPSDPGEHPAPVAHPGRVR